MEFIKGCLETCWMILIHPTSRTFVSESEKGEKQFSLITAWLMVLSIYIGIVFGIASGDGWLLLLSALSFSLIIPLTVILTTSVMHLLYQRVFHRTQYIYDQLLYITTAVLFTFQVIGLPVWLALPQYTAKYFGYAVVIYQLILVWLAFKYLSKLSYWQAAFTVFLSAVAGVVIFLCVGPFLQSMMGGVNSIF
jgi:hypothetical protein